MVICRYEQSSRKFEPPNTYIPSSSYLLVLPHILQMSAVLVVCLVPYFLHFGASPPNHPTVISLFKMALKKLLKWPSRNC